VLERSSSCSNDDEYRPPACRFSIVLAIFEQALKPQRFAFGFVATKDLDVGELG